MLGDLNRCNIFELVRRKRINKFKVLKVLLKYIHYNDLNNVINELIKI